MKTLIAFVFTAIATAQTVTISQQPGVVFVATFGARLPVSVYSAEVCSLPGSTAAGSWGQVRQIAEQGGINIVDNVLVPPTAQRAQNKTTLHKLLIAGEIVGIAAAGIGGFAGAPAWLLKAGVILAGAAEVGQQPLQASEAQAQSTITAALAALANPTAQFNVANGACVSSALMLGAAVANFKPVVTTLPSYHLIILPSAPDTPTGPVNVPQSKVPVQTMTHPAVDDVEVAAWEVPVRDHVFGAALAQ